MGTAAGLPDAIARLRAREAALFALPASPLMVAVRACESSATNLGTAKAARMPRIVMTTTSSIRVNPLSWDGFILLLRGASAPLCKIRARHALDQRIGRIAACLRHFLSADAAFGAS